MTKIMIPAWVDGTLTPVEKIQVHRQGLRHKAVSVFLLDEDDRILVQQRALTKYHCPGQWANTCCTHPAWDEDNHACAVRRLDEELGLQSPPLSPSGTVEYRADVGGGMVEHEVVALFFGRLPKDAQFQLNPDEVAQVAWHSPAELASMIAENPNQFAPWLRIYLTEHTDLVLQHARRA